MEYIFTFLEGVASFISPCLLPMLPIYISYFAGSNEEKSNQKLKNAIGFVIGFTIIFVLLSIFTSTLGKLVGEYLKYIKIIFGSIVILLGMNYLGIFQLNFLNKTSKLKFQMKNLNLMKSIAFGMAFSVSWTPCIGTFLSSALLLVSKEQNILKGILLILLYSIGLGVPFIVSVILMDQMKKAFDFIKKHYSSIIKISGWILIAMGIYMIFF